MCNYLSYLILFCIAETPGHGSGWAETPRTDRAGADLIQDTPGTASKRRSRWDETPSNQMTPSAMTPSAMTPHTPGTPSTPMGTPGATPSMMTPSGVTPTGQKAMGMATPTPGMYSLISKLVNCSYSS